VAANLLTKQPSSPAPPAHKNGTTATSSSATHTRTARFAASTSGYRRSVQPEISPVTLWTTPQ
jgi:hypothetical protein